MPITASAKKQLRQSKKRKVANLKYKIKIKTLTKQALSLAKDGKMDELKSILPKVFKALDKGVKARVIEKNTASRRKSLVSRGLVSKKGAPEKNSK